MNLPAAYGLFSQGVLVAALLCALWPTARRGWVMLIPLNVAVIAILVPIGGPSVAEHLRAVWGDPAVVTTLLLLVYLVAPRRLPQRPSRRVALGLGFVLPVALYSPLVLSQPLIDLYPVGWHPLGFLFPLLVIVFMLRNRIGPRWICLMAVAVLAFAGGLMESSNLWDYLVDPGLLVGLAVCSRARSSPVSLQSVQHSPAAP